MSAHHKRHDEREILIAVPPHAAARLGPGLVNEHGRVDVVPSPYVPDDGRAFVIDLTAFEEHIEATLRSGDLNLDP